MTQVNYLFEGGSEGLALSNANSGSSTSSVGGGSHVFAAAARAHGGSGFTVSNVAGSASFRRFPFAAAATTWQASIVVKLPASAVGGNVVLASFCNSSGVGRLKVIVNSSGTIYLADNGSAHTATVAASGDGVTWGGQYRIAIQAVGGSTTASQVNARAYSGTPGTGWTSAIGTAIAVTNWDLSVDQIVGVDLGITGYVTAAITVGFDDLQVNDGAGSAIGDYVAVNAKPTVLGSPAVQNVAAGAVVSATFTATDTDGSIVSRATDFAYPASGPAISNGGTQTPSFTAGTAPNLYQLRQTVTDDGGATSDPAVVEVRVPTASDFSTLNGNGVTVGSAWTNVGALATMGATLRSTDDANYIESPTPTGVEQTITLRWQPATTRSSLTETFRFAASDATSVTVVVRLLEGSTVRKSFAARTFTGTTFANAQYNLSASEIASIGDWGNLFLQFAVTA